MRWLWSSLLVVMASLTAAVAVLVYLVPPSAVERHVLAAVSRATGLKLSASGAADVTYFPSIDLTVRKVIVVPASAATPQVQIRRVDATLDWLPLLTGWTLHFSRVQINAPIIAFAPAPGGIGAPSQKAPRKPRSYPPFAVELAAVKIEDARIEGVGDGIRISELDAIAANLSKQRPIEMAIDLILNGRPRSGTLRIDNPDRLFGAGTKTSELRWELVETGASRATGGPELRSLFASMIARATEDRGAAGPQGPQRFGAIRSRMASRFN